MLGALTETQIDDLLRSEHVGRLGCVADGQPYVVPVTYVYDGEYIYGHAGEGMKIQIARKNPNVCFEVDRIQNMANWRSVIAWGTFEELSGDEATRTMTMLMEQLAPLTTSETSHPAHDGVPARPHRSDVGNHHPVVYRIRVNQATGRFEKQ